MYERKCIVCGKEYRYCSHCNEFNPNEKWRYLYCGSECKEIYSVCEDFINTKKPEVDAKVAQKKLANLNTEKVINKGVKTNIEEIFSVSEDENNVVKTATKNTRKRNKKSKPIVNKEIITIENTTLDNPISEDVEEIIVSEDVINNVD